MRNVIGDKIQELLALRGNDARQLAERVQKSEVYIRKIISGEKIPPADVIADIARALEVSTGVFLDDYEYISFAERLNELARRVGLEQTSLRILKGLSAREKEVLGDLMFRLNPDAMSSLARKYLRNSIRLSYNLEDIDVLDTERELEVELVAVEKGAKYYVNWQVGKYDNRPSGYYDFNCSLETIYRRPGGRIELWRGVESPAYVYTRVIFEPELDKDERVRFILKQNYTKSRLATIDILAELISEDKLLNKRPLERAGKIIGYPTDLYECTVLFPPGYEPMDPKIFMVIGRTYQQQEMSRFEKGTNLKTMKVDSESRWLYELKVEKPICGTTYLIEWTPPTREQVLEARRKFLAEDKSRSGRRLSAGGRKNNK